MQPTLTDWIVAGSSVVMATAVVLQFLMWRVAKEQNDLTSKPRLRLKRATVTLRGSSRTVEEAVMKEKEIPTIDKYHPDIESEWQSHVQSSPANLSAIEHTAIGFLVENNSNVVATGFKMNLLFKVKGNPTDQQVIPKQYKRTIEVETDIRPSSAVFVPLLRCQLLFHVVIEGKIMSVRGPLGNDEIIKENKQVSQKCIFENEELIKALATPDE